MEGFQAGSSCEVLTVLLELEDSEVVGVPGWRPAKLPPNTVECWEWVGFDEDADDEASSSGAFGQGSSASASGAVKRC